jgi:hypothetical protein
MSSGVMLTMRRPPKNGVSHSSMRRLVFRSARSMDDGQLMTEGQDLEVEGRA